MKLVIILFLLSNYISTFKTASYYESTEENHPEMQLTLLVCKLILLIFG